MEASARAKDEHISALRLQLESQRIEINDYRHRLGLPLLAANLPPDPVSGDPGGLGLMVQLDEWDVAKTERD